MGASACSLAHANPKWWWPFVQHRSVRCKCINVKFSANAWHIFSRTISSSHAISMAVIIDTSESNRNTTRMFIKRECAFSEIALSAFRSHSRNSEFGIRFCQPIKLRSRRNQFRLKTTIERRSPSNNLFISKLKISCLHYAHFIDLSQLSVELSGRVLFHQLFSIFTYSVWIILPSKHTIFGWDLEFMWISITHRRQSHILPWLAVDVSKQRQNHDSELLFRFKGDFLNSFLAAEKREKKNEMKLKMAKAPSTTIISVIVGLMCFDGIEELTDHFASVRNISDSHFSRLTLDVCCCCEKNMNRFRILFHLFATL